MKGMRASAWYVKVSLGESVAAAAATQQGWRPIHSGRRARAAAHSAGAELEVNTRRQDAGRSGVPPFRLRRGEGN